MRALHVIPSAAPVDGGPNVAVRALAEAIGDEVDERRFRGNVLIDGLAPFEELAWQGRRVRIGEAEFQITIPEFGTVRAVEPPLVVLTSNRTREVHDALKRRCLYQWIEYPSFEKELAIVRERVPEAPARLAGQVTAIVQELRGLELYKVPGVSETLDWARALVVLDRQPLDPAAVEQTLGVVLKAKDDIDAVRGERLAGILSRVSGRQKEG